MQRKGLGFKLPSVSLRPPAAWCCCMPLCMHGRITKGPGMGLLLIESPNKVHCLTINNGDLMVRQWDNITNFNRIISEMAITCG